jgi:hypothetical protein
MLLAFFPQRDCVTLKRPVEDESLLQVLTLLALLVQTYKY